MKGKRTNWKVGDVVDNRGVETVVMNVRKSKGGPVTEYGFSAEPIAKQKGFITWDQISGFKTEHHAPPFVPHGKRRDPANLKPKDWDFVELMQRPLEEKKVALFHELAREAARVRLACATLEAGAPIAEQWEEKKAAALQKWQLAIDEVERASSDYEAAKTKKKKEKAFSQLEKAKEKLRLAECEESHISVSSGNGKERLDFRAADAFLQRLEKRFPYGAGVLMAWLVGKDVGWNCLTLEERENVMQRQREIEAKRVKHEGRFNKDVPGDGPGWPYDSPIQFAGRHWQEIESEWPCYGYNDGKPGRLVLAPRRNGKDAPLVLSESLEMCVCLNFSDAEILESFGDWLQRRRKRLHDDLREFREGEGVGLRMDERRINKAFKAIAALRLRASCPSKKDAAHAFREIYEAKRSKKEKAEPAQPGDVQKLAYDAVKLGLEFLPYCPLDSAPVRDPRKHPWDHLCSNCGKLHSMEKEPSKDLGFPWRCSNCDHRESSRWDGRDWIIYDS